MKNSLTGRSNQRIFIPDRRDSLRQPKKGKIMFELKDPDGGPSRFFTEEQMTAERDRLLLAWEKAKKALEVAKEDEMKARKASVAFMFDETTTGTQKVDLGGGYVAKAVIKINYGFIKNEDGKVDKRRIEMALSKIEHNSAAGELIAERLVKWTPDLSLTEYKLLSEKDRKIIDAVIITTDAAPTLEIVAPKSK
jgi:hypothetical protein